MVQLEEAQQVRGVQQVRGAQQVWGAEQVEDQAAEVMELEEDLAVQLVEAMEPERGVSG